MSSKRPFAEHKKSPLKSGLFFVFECSDSRKLICVQQTPVAGFFFTGIKER